MKLKADAAAGVVEDSSANLSSGSDDTEAEQCKERLVEVATRIGVMDGMAKEE